MRLVAPTKGTAQVTSLNPAVASFGGAAQASFQIPFRPEVFLQSGSPGPLQVNAVTVPTTVTLNAVFRACTTDFASDSAPTLTTSLQITDLPEPAIHRFRLKISNLDGTLLHTIGLRLVENADGSSFFEPDSGDYVGASGGGGGGPQQVNHLTLDQQIYKLGQGWDVQIVPLLTDGSEGQPLALTESINDADDQSDQGPGSSAIFSSDTELFAGQVLVHFPLNATAARHQFFPVHSGTSNLNLEFFAFQDLTLTMPVLITNCSGPIAPCTPQLGNVHSEFDALLMRFADRNGIPPQLLKAQIQQESGFNPRAYRYEPLSIDWKQFNKAGSVSVPAALTPWLLAQSKTCSTDATTPGNVPAGSNIVLSGSDVVPREKIYGVFVSNGAPLCRVTQIPATPNARGIVSTDAALSMENILYANDGCFFRSLCAGWSRINARSFDEFTDFQVDHPPFTGQTVVAASYGLHQLLYETAVGMGYQHHGAGLSPASLFEASTSLDLGTEYLARLYLIRGSSQGSSFSDEKTFFFQFGSSLRAFNGPPKLSFGQIFAKCGVAEYVADPKNPSPYDYPCLILKRYPKFVPVPLGGN